MGSDYTTIVKLEPFYQRFLRANFRQEEGKPFSFPVRNDFSTWIGFSVMRRPHPFDFPDYGESRFEIVIPYLEHKNPAFYNYLSEKRQRTFRRMVYDLMKMLFHIELKQAIDKYGYTRIEAIDHLTEEFGFLPEDYDRLVKEYQRWLRRMQDQRYIENKKRCKAAEKNLVS